MTLPDGYSDVPPGKIAAVVTHLEMTARPALPPDADGPWTLRRVEHPDLDWFRELYRRIGAEWLWFSRLRMSDAQLAALIQPPAAEIYALVHDGLGRRPAASGFQRTKPMRTVAVRRHRPIDRLRCRAFPDEPRAGAGVVASH
jgi:hypothetical protein